MSNFKCKECGNEQEGVRGMPPASCARCHAKGPIWGKPGADESARTVAPRPAAKPGAMPAPKREAAKLADGASGASAARSAPPMPGLRRGQPQALPAAPEPAGYLNTKSGPVPLASPAPPAAPSPSIAPAPPPVAQAPPSPEPQPVTPVTPLQTSAAQQVVERSPAQAPQGRVVWTYPASPQAPAAPRRTCPALDGRGQSYFCVDNKLIAFADRDGQLERLWSYETGNRIAGSPVIGPDGNLRVHSGDGHLHVVSPAGLRVGDPAQVGEPLGWATPLVDARNVTWICGYHGGLMRVDADGITDPSPYFRGKHRFDCAGVIDEGVLYVGAENACVYAITLDGRAGINQWDHLAARGRVGWFVNSALALAPDGALVVASRDDRLYGFGRDGQALWSIEMEGQMLGSPVVDADGSIYVGLSLTRDRDAPRGALVRIDGISRKVRWRYSTEAPVESTPVIGDDGAVYFGDNNGVVHAVDSDGKAIWTEQVAAAVRSPGALLGKGRVVFGLENGQFVALRCDSSALRPGAWAKQLGNSTNTAAAHGNGR